MDTTIEPNEPNTDVPEWLIPVPDTVTLPLVPISTNEVAFESLIEQMETTGITLAEFCREHHTAPVAANFRAWVMRDPKRRERYEQAKLTLVSMVEDEMLRIADASDAPMEDVQRSKLRIDTRKWWLAIQDPKRYSNKSETIHSGAAGGINITIAGIGELKDVSTYDGEVINGD